MTYSIEDRIFWTADKLFFDVEKQSLGARKVAF
jgi:hypothetical protein